MLQLTYEELMLISGAISILEEHSQIIATDRTVINSKENRGQARRQLKTIRAIHHKLEKELEKYPNGKPINIIHIGA